MHAHTTNRSILKNEWNRNESPNAAGSNNINITHRSPMNRQILTDPRELTIYSR